MLGDFSKFFPKNNFTFRSDRVNNVTMSQENVTAVQVLNPNFESC